MKFLAVQAATIGPLNNMIVKAWLGVYEGS